jgi:2,3-bisphosphoglycerate-independent phosphoglycerate mutase
MTQKAALIVLDGFGIGKDSPFNAIKNAKMPFYKDLVAKYPHSQILTHGNVVGLPDGVMGNSEVGHMTMGAGRIIYQDLTRISLSIQNKDFFKNPVLRKTIETGAKKTGRVHLMGLLSDGGVHSHIDHLFALIELCAEIGVPSVSIHVFLDGRDTPPHSSATYVKKLLEHPLVKDQKNSKTKIILSTLSGRYWAMDRDKRWDRVEKAYKTLSGQVEAVSESPFEIIEKSHKDGKSDEFLEPVLLNQDGAIQKDDAIIFFNYRADRAREIVQEILKHAETKPSAFAGMAEYDKSISGIEAAFKPQSTSNIFAEIVEGKGLSQLRIAETEKYAHVTYFFNCGREQPFKKEDRVLIESPKDVATYDLKPEMSAPAVADETAMRIQSGKYDFMLLNFANADMIGHTGNYEAAVKSMEALDICLAQAVGACQKSGYHVLLTADHGNCEEMRDSEGRIHTQHTLNPVPAIWVAPNTAIAPQSARTALKDGTLADIMPTLCDLMKLPLPKEVTGKSLLP